MVEIIIVIAMIAILSAALARQIIKYIEKDMEGNYKITYQIGDITVKTSSMGNTEAKNYLQSKGYIY